MKYILIVAAFFAGIVVYHCYTLRKEAIAEAAAQAAIPNTIEGFYAAVGNGDITFQLLTDPFGIYDRNGKKIGYWTTDGSVYTMSGTLVVKGFGGIKTK